MNGEFAQIAINALDQTMLSDLKITEKEASAFSEREGS
jgi:hypothetical protein